MGLYGLLYNRSFVVGGLALGLLLALVASVHNVALAFVDTKAVDHPMIGWLAAVAVEVGVAFVGLAIAARARDGDRNVRLYGAVLLFVAISMFANYDSAFSALIGGGAVTIAALRAADPWLLTKAGLLGAALPVMVLAILASVIEMATANGSPARPTGGGQRAPMARPTAPQRSAPVPNSAPSRMTKAERVAARRVKMAAILTSSGSKVEAAETARRALGVSARTAWRDIAALTRGRVTA